MNFGNLMPTKNISKTLEYNIDMIEQLLQELKDGWGYDTSELSTIREKLEEYGHACYWLGYNDRGEEVTAYYAGFANSKKSDIDDYE